MAAAASVMLVAGFAGGALAHGFARESTVAAPQTAVATNNSAPQAPDLTAIENKLRDFDARLVRISNTAAPQNDDYSALTAEIDSLRVLNAKLVQLVNGFDARWDAIMKTIEMNNGVLGSKVRNLEQAVQAIAQSK
jgi:hypothetical protein